MRDLTLFVLAELAASVGCAAVGNPLLAAALPLLVGRAVALRLAADKHDVLAYPRYVGNGYEHIRAGKPEPLAAGDVEALYPVFGEGERVVEHPAQIFTVAERDDVHLAQFAKQKLHINIYAAHRLFVRRIQICRNIDLAC